ncbi:MAG TPA: hypothetical protein VFH78_00995, partial [Candidatus Thermoplasmatota archaeon]|nr:hypothetical protein [Candidatus Thermoplasmatota archaeon]
MLPVWTLAAALALAAPLATPPTHAQALEIDILEAYLAEHDALPATPHCARSHGYALTPAGPVRSPAGPTNGVLDEHFSF